MSETLHKIDKIINLQERTLEEIKALETTINAIENRLSYNEKEAQTIRVECAENSKSIKYQWWIITFIWFLILIIFSNI